MVNKQRDVKRDSEPAWHIVSLDILTLFSWSFVYQCRSKCSFTCLPNHFCVVGFNILVRHLIGLYCYFNFKIIYNYVKYYNFKMFLFYNLIKRQFTLLLIFKPLTIIGHLFVCKMNRKHLSVLHSLILHSYIKISGTGLYPPRRVKTL